MKSSSLTALSDAVSAIAPVQTPVNLDAVQRQVEQSLLAIRLAATPTATRSAYQKAHHNHQPGYGIKVSKTC
jgi:hypothetical protein